MRLFEHTFKVKPNVCLSPNVTQLTYYENKSPAKLLSENIYNDL